MAVNVIGDSVLCSKSSHLGSFTGSRFSQEFNPTNHLIRFQYLVDQRQSIDYLANRGCLRCVNDAMVFCVCRKPEKITILGEYYTAFFLCQIHMFSIRRAQCSCFRYSQNVNVSLAEPINNGLRDVFIGIEPNLRH